MFAMPTPELPADGLQFPLTLAERYQPKKLEDFVGVHVPKKAMQAFAVRPFKSAWFFLGDSGLGKTSMAEAVSTLVNGEIHEIPSQSCNVESIDAVMRICAYVPRGGKNAFHIIIANALCAKRNRDYRRIGSQRMRWLIVLLMLGTLAKADDLPEAPKPKVADRQFWTAVGTLGASVAADGISTVRMLDRGNFETNPVLGRHPSPARVGALSGAYFAGETVLAYELKRFGQRHRWARYLWLIEPSIQAGQHAAFAYHNESLPDHRKGHK
jgi:hypothetical protein